MTHGYIALWMPDHPCAMRGGYVLEHRAVAAEQLGRPLHEGEVVHHIDGNRQNNRPENLQVFPSQSAHATHHRASEREQRCHA